MLRIALVALALVVATATHAHYPPPPISMETAAAGFAVDDGCAPSPMDATDYDTWHAWYGLWDGDDYREPFMRGPVEEGVTTWFGTASQAVFKSGRANITIRLDDAYGRDRKLTFRSVARSLASLPGGLLQRLPTELTLDLTESKHDPNIAATAYNLRDCDYNGEKLTCSHKVVVSSAWFDLNDDGQPIMPHPAFEDMLIHEFAHVLDDFSGIVNQAPGLHPDSANWSQSEEWLAVVAESPCAVSAYATTNAREDFAESVLAWFGHYAGRQGRLPREAREALRERLGERWPLIVSYMHDRFDEGDD